MLRAVSARGERGADFGTAVRANGRSFFLLVLLAVLQGRWGGGRERPRGLRASMGIGVLLSALRAEVVGLGT